jgi:colanic acid/amylovoran biosynthesis glycosyltransferase
LTNPWAKSLSGEGMKKIALIYSSIGHPEMPYMTSLRTEIQRRAEDRFEILIYSLSHLDKDRLSENNLIYISSRLNTLKRLFLFMFLYPFTFFKYLSNQWGKSSIKELFKDWTKFAPLIATEPDILHITQSGIYSKFSRNISFKKMIVTFIGADLTLRPLYTPAWVDLLRDELFPKVDCAHCISNFLRDESLKYGGKFEKSKLIHIGIDTNVYKPSSRPHNQDNIIITTTGRLIWNKGYIYALQAIKQLQDLGYSVQYNIIGQGDTYTEIYFWRRLLNIERNVRILGYLGLNEKLMHLEETDIYIQPSTIDEGQCVTILEAMSAGLPVVATKAGGIPDMVLDRVTGILVPRADSCALADAIAELIENKELRAKMGEAGRKRILDHFSLEHEVDQWIELYSTI